MGNTFEDFLVEHRDMIDKIVVDYYADRVGTGDKGRFLYGPLRDYAANGGKRHRPIVCLIGCAAVGGDPKLAYSSAAAVEHFHTAALIHDDIADDGELRRGEPCLHIKVGEGLAINAGDLALSQVTGTVLADELLTSDVKVRVLNELVDMTTRTIEGQALDLGWARDGRWDLTVDDYLLMAGLKTAYYSVSIPLVCGAIVGSGSEEQIEAFRSFGMSAGLAFQIQDDLLNLVGDKESVQKDYRSDITEGKRTMNVLHALANAPASQAEELRRILNSSTSDPQELERAVQIMEQAGSIDYARSRSLELTQEAKRILEPVELEDEPKMLLMSMADFFVHRIS